jgi:hypothetical protein
VGEGIYLAIPFFSRCSDLQPTWLVNRTQTDIIYIGRKLYVFASADDEIAEYAKQGSAFGDRIANASRIAPGSKLKIDDYSMSFDGDFAGTHRVVLLRGAEQVEMLASIGKLAGYLWDRMLMAFICSKNWCRRLRPVSPTLAACSSRSAAATRMVRWGWLQQSAMPLRHQQFAIGIWLMLGF